MNLLDILQNQLSDDVVDKLSGSLRTDKEQTVSAANGVFATLVTALSKNAQDPQGAAALNNALERDHDGSVLNDLMGLIGGGAPAASPKATNGVGILEHILGGKTNNVVQMVSKSSGMDFLKSAELMKMLAPMVMGVLGKTKQQNGLDIGGLSSLLSGTVQQASNKQEGMSMIAKVLDADGDGNVMDDLAGIGMKMFSGLFKK